jgi:putative DeoR family transcriptional regulator (stage III sporulation protein D)
MNKTEKGLRGLIHMQDYIQKRVMDISNYILESQATVRQTATIFGVSKSTVHKDLTERLPVINEIVAKQVRDILENNKAERHLRGGEATRKKYKHEKEEGK